MNNRVSDFNVNDKFGEKKELTDQKNPQNQRGKNFQRRSMSISKHPKFIGEGGMTDRVPQ